MLSPTDTAPKPSRSAACAKGTNHSVRTPVRLIVTCSVPMHGTVSVAVIDFTPRMRLVGSGTP